MPRILERPPYIISLVVLSLLFLMSLPGGKNSAWSYLRPTASAATFFTVNSTGDGPDSNVADGVCNDGTGACTLRAAVQQANATAGDDTITFDISLNFSTMTLNSALPNISDNLNFSGNGSSLLTVRRSSAAGTPDFRIFTINSGTTVTITGLTISNGKAPGTTAPDSFGGGILNSGTLTVLFCAVSGNSAMGGGGGGIHNLATLTVSNSTVSGNTGGGIANNNFGGVTTATVHNSVISGNTLGSGIYNNGINAIATLTIDNSTISGNTTDNVAGGGGIFNGAGSFTSRATATITNSTISGNNASAGAGGGIYSAAVFGNALTTLTITNCTITGNTSSADRDGGGILHFSSGSGSTAVATVNDSTIVGNAAGSGTGKGGGIAVSSADSTTTFSLRNTIVAKNTASASAIAPDLSGEFDSQDYNLIQNLFGFTLTGTTTHNLMGPEPELAPLGNYGGITKTMIPLPNSPAIDAGDVSNLPLDTTDADLDGNTAEVLPVDQRGFPRVVNTHFDIGAVETDYAITATSGSGQSTTINTAFALPLKVTATESGNPREGLLVTYVKPPTGASGNFAVSPLLTTDANGVAAMGFSANGMAGSYNVTAGFSFSALPGATFSLTNLKAATTTTVTTSPNPSAFGEMVTLTATVTSTTPVPFGGNVPTGTVQFKVDGSNFGPPELLDTSGVVSLNTTSLAVGSHAVAVDYSGDANFTASSGTAVSPQVVNPELNINDVSITEGNSGTRTADFTVALTAASSVQVKVDFATANESATAPSDYQATSGTLTFNPGQTTQTISVIINGDTSFEVHETFQVNLSNPVNAVIGQGQGVGTILTDDARPLIGFSQSNYTVGESEGVAVITLSRINNNTDAVTIDYSTMASGSNPCTIFNGQAFSRCDFTPSQGTVRFGPGETSKTFTVLISQDNYVEGPESLFVTLSNPTGLAGFGPISSATLTITDDASEPAANPVDDPDVFVRQHYHDFLNREADAAGLAFWKNQITECQQPGATCSAEVRRINVSGAFFLSIEFQETGYFAYRTYKASYGNIPGTPVPVRFSEFLPDTQQLGKDVIVGQPPDHQQLESNKVAFMLAFVSRPRFTNQHPTTLTPTQFVDTLFANAGVTPSATQRSAAIGEFSGAGDTSDTAARARALRLVTDNATLKQQETNRAFVLMQYFGYLRRNPDDAPEPALNFDGYNFWLAKLNQFNGNFVNAELVKAFLISGEYRRRFGL